MPIAQRRPENSGLAAHWRPANRSAGRIRDHESRKLLKTKDLRDASSIHRRIPRYGNTVNPGDTAGGNYMRHGLRSGPNVITPTTHFTSRPLAVRWSGSNRARRWPASCRISVDSAGWGGRLAKPRVR